MQLDELTRDEQLALVGLVRLLVRLDGSFSESEREAVDELADDLGSERFWELIDEAGTSLSESEAIRAQAQRVTRDEARLAIYDALLDLAMRDTISVEEDGLLEWLRSTWRLEDA